MSRKHRGRIQGDTVSYGLPSPAGGILLETFVPWTLIKRGCRKEIITPLDAPQQFAEVARRERLLRQAGEDTALLRAFGLAYHWQRLLDEGRFSSVAEIAEAEGLDPGRASRIARLAYLAPDIVDAVATGAAPDLRPGSRWPPASADPVGRAAAAPAPRLNPLSAVAGTVFQPTLLRPRGAVHKPQRAHSPLSVAGTEQTKNGTDHLQPPVAACLPTLNVQETDRERRAENGRFGAVSAPRWPRSTGKWRNRRHDRGNGQQKAQPRMVGLWVNGGAGVN